ncbi:MAG: hypothetical protein ACLQPD_19070 [Desulfomonilaceae bacterium]
MVKASVPSGGDYYHEWMKQGSKDILSALLDSAQPDAVRWSSKDLRSILEHQLATPFACELDHLTELAECSVEEASEVIESCGSRTFGDLLLECSPPDRALRMLKDYAKKSLTRQGNLPRDVARVLYICSILRARQSGIGNITSLDDANLAREARRCLTFGWLPDQVRELLSLACQTGD